MAITGGDPSNHSYIHLLLLLLLLLHAVPDYRTYRRITGIAIGYMYMYGRIRLLQYTDCTDAMAQRQTDRQTDRQTERQTDRETDRDGPEFKGPPDAIAKPSDQKLKLSVKNL